MKKQGSTKRQSQSGGMIIGRVRFAAISAVEGIRLTAEMERRVAEFDRKRLTPEERVRAIVAAHRKG
jgi:hypothetical protein